MMLMVMMMMTGRHKQCNSGCDSEILAVVV
jgi:hypothetical protein